MQAQASSRLATLRTFVMSSKSSRAPQDSRKSKRFILVTNQVLNDPRWKQCEKLRVHQRF
jgi:hypothetical protein